MGRHFNVRCKHDLNYSKYSYHAFKGSCESPLLFLITFLLQVPACDTHVQTILTTAVDFYGCPSHLSLFSDDIFPPLLFPIILSHLPPAFFSYHFTFFPPSFQSRRSCRSVATVTQLSQSSHSDGSSKQTSRLTSCCFITEESVFFQGEK